jgi:hypothetical protein
VLCASVQALCGQIERQMDGYNAQELVTTLWCLNKLNHHPGESVLGAYAAEIEGRLGQLSTKQLSASLAPAACTHDGARAVGRTRAEA